MKNLNFKIDPETDTKFLETLPEGFVQATMDDFHNKGKKKIGMFYLLKGGASGLYYPRTVNESLTGEKLLPFIKGGQVFVKK